MSELSVQQATERWIKEVVVGLNLCPFAAPVVNANRILYHVSEEMEIEAIYRDLLSALDQLQRSDEQELATGFLVLGKGLADFNEYLAFLETVDDMLPEAGLDGVIQVAGFHPDYCFADSDEADPANYTNRSPYPMFHLIREDDLEAAVASHPDPAGIPARNIQLLRDMGLEEMRQRLRRCFTAN
ncbi:MAG: DUF1415 domain-containing protein [Chromatiales bacterium]|nr:DUF1415 domain-containing protein [Chromatiales bacterium]